MSCDWPLDVGGRGESLCEILFSRYCTADIENISMILYIVESIKGKYEGFMLKFGNVRSLYISYRIHPYQTFELDETNESR